MGIPIYSGSKLYRVYANKIYPDNEYQLKHHTRLGNHVLSIRCVSNYFGSLMDESEIPSLYSGVQS